MEEKINTIYEVGYHVLPTVAEERLAAEVTALKDMLESNGAVFISEEFPKLRPLAYMIKKAIAGKYHSFSSAYFGWVKFELPTASIPAVKKALDEHPQILRSLLIETVRESTLAPIRPAYQARPKDAKKPEEGGKPVSTEELDKTIDQLVVE